MADDILIGPGKLYRAPVAEANPDESTVAYGAAWGGNWVDMGGILEGEPVTVEMSDEHTDVYLEEYTAPVKTARTRRTTTITATLAEHSVANMAVWLAGTAETTAAAGGGQKGYSEIPFGAGVAVNTYKWGVEGFRADSTGTLQPVRWFIHIGYLKPNGGISYAKQNPSALQVQVMALADTSQDANEEIGILQIVTAAATAT